METTEKDDLRLYYLAIHDILKNRGHFIFEGQNFENISDIKPVEAQFKIILDDEFKIILDDEFKIILDDEFFNKIIKILTNKESKRSEKTIETDLLIKEYDSNFNEISKKQFKEILKLLISSKAKPHIIFNDSDLKECAEIEFEGEKFELKKDEYLSFLGEDRMHLINIIKSIYDFIKLKLILDGNKSISDVQIKRYKEHKEDLKDLKNLIKKYDNESRDLYNKVFRYSYDKEEIKTTNNNYAKYIGTDIKSNKKYSDKKCTYEEFIKFLVKQLADFKDNKDFDVIFNKIENNEFLLKQISSLNSVLPYQIHEFELDKILSNLFKFYPVFAIEEEDCALNDTFNSKITKIQKIKLLFSFRIPYYIGPLNNNKTSLNSWIVKHDEFNNKKIFPWNIEKIVDIEKTKEQFIKRMLNNCTYLDDEKVLPKDSILYSEFNVLNEINNIKINGNDIDPLVKQKIFDDLFLNYKKVTVKKLQSYLLSYNYIDEESIITGIDKELKNNMKSYVEIKEILKEKFNRNDAEIIIEQSVLSLGDRDKFVNLLKNRFSYLNDFELSKLSKLKYSDWGRFSKKFLLDIKFEDKETGKIDNVINFMRETNKNLMQLMSNDYTLSYELMNIKKEIKEKDLNYDFVNNLRVSPTVKKMIWQTIKMLKETIKYINRFSKNSYKDEPAKIFIEMAREKEEIKERKESRKNNLIQLYKSIKNNEVYELIEKLDKKTDLDLRSEKLFLYFTQMGRCAYSGEIIDIDNMELYDIDHIIPRSKKTDDSPLNNKVLVKKTLNNSKKNEYPISKEIREKQGKYWKMLFDYKLISKIKYERLIRSTELTYDELSEFISRQLVETRQITVLLADILKSVYKNTEIVYVKAGNVSRFRDNFEILKCRDINDLHHAHDAYLNIVVGNVYNTKFTNNPKNFIKKCKDEGQKYSLNFDTIFKKYDIYGKNKKIVWEKEKTIQLVKKTIDSKNVIYTTEQYEGKGALFNATIQKAKNIKKSTDYLPLKKEFKNIKYKDIYDIYEKYGAYNSISGAYFTLISKKTKKGEEIFLDYVPIYIANNLKSKSDFLNYFKKIYKNEEIKIIKEKILFKTIFKIDGFEYFINGRSNNSFILQPSLQPKFNINLTQKIKKILSIYEKYLKFKNNKIILDSIDINEIRKTIDDLKDRLYKKPYNNRFNIPKYLKFLNCNLIDDKEILIKLLVAILNLLKSTVSASDFSFLKDTCYIDSNEKFTYGNKVGTIYKVISSDKLNHFSIIYKSITGLYKKEIKIK